MNERGARPSEGRAVGSSGGIPYETGEEPEATLATADKDVPPAVGAVTAALVLAEEYDQG